MQHEIKTTIDLLNERGQLSEPGWARHLHWKYDRAKVANFAKIMEWDYYLVANEDFGASFSIAHTRKFSRMTVNFFDYRQKYFIRKNSVIPGDIQMPPDADGPVHFCSAEAEGEYIREPGKHHIRIRFDNFSEGQPYILDIDLTVPATEKMVIATPFDEGSDLFFYNMKMNCMKASGTATIGDKTYVFTPERSFSVLDWGRGVWPDHNRWYWGSGSGVLDGKDFGFNIGYGFGNLSAATENVIFYDGKAHKFDQIVFNIPESSYLDPWTIVSNDGRFIMDFQPILDRDSEITLQGTTSSQHQVFGRFTGKAILDDGTELYIKDFFGFAEDVINNWS